MPFCVLAQPQTPIELELLGSYQTGIFDEGAAEITAYDPVGYRLYYVNAFTSSIDVIGIKDPYNPDSLFSIDVTPYGDGANSIIAWDGFVAAAVENNNTQSPGSVVFFDTAGVFITQVAVGALPDMLTLTPDEQTILVANEGEPDDDYLVDPDGSISIIDISGGVAGLTQGQVTTLDFSPFEYIRNSFDSASYDNWPVTVFPNPYNASSGFDLWIAADTLEDLTAVHGSYLWAMRDLENGNGGGAFFHTLTFDPVYVGSRPDRTLSFKYKTVGWDVGFGDSLGYIIAFDNGTNWDMANYVNLVPGPTPVDTGWVEVEIPLPNAMDTVRLQLMAKQNGGNDWAAFDDVKISFLDNTTRVFGNDYLATVAADMEPEYITVAPNGMTAYVACQENNALAIVDLVAQEITDVVGFGWKDHSMPGFGLDPSDRDDSIKIAPHPVKGIYTPDAIASFEVNGMTYIATANEGDAREYDGYEEEDRIKDLTLDTLAFPNYAMLQNDTVLGRLTITLSLGDTDYDGEYEELFCFGGRSFSIYDENGVQVYDSGDDFEQITASELKDHFNANNDDNDSFESRSDNKGPEPEGIVVQEIEGKTYAFIGLERIGGIMVYDVSDPTTPQFLQYLNNRDFSFDADTTAAGDLGPEGLLFIPKEESPNLRNLLVVSNEVSGSVSLFQINLNNTINGAYTLDGFDMNTTPAIGPYDGDTIYEGGISGMHYVAGSDNEFYFVTDRGPNAVANNNPNAMGQAVKFFPFPGYAPKIMHVKAEADTVSILSSGTIKRPGGTDATGIPLPLGQGSTGEVAWSDTMGTVVTPDSWGLDSEGIVESNDEELWLVEEYGSTVWRLNKQTFEVIERYTPFPVETEDVPIDSMYGKRRPNRGFEGVAYTPNGKIYAILQGPVYNPTSTVGQNSQLHRMLEIDPNTGEMNTYIYEHRPPIGAIRNRDWKIGDLVAVNNDEFLVLEHAERQGWNYKDVYRIDISNATPLTMEDFGGLTLEELVDAATAAANGVQVVEKTHYLDLLELGWDLTHDKPEGITIIDDSTVAVVNDNDYGIDAPNDDGVIVYTGKTTRLYIYDLPQNKHLDYVLPYCDYSLGGDTIFCEASTFTLQVPSGFTNVVWSDSSMMNSLDVTMGGSYSVVALNSDGCRVNDTIILTQVPNPIVNLGMDTTICDTSVFALDAGSAAGYLWSDGSMGQTLAITATGMYSVVITDANGCTDEDTVTITVTDCPGVGIEDEFAALVTQVYPNPSNGLLSLEFGEIQGQLINLDLYTMTGASVYQKSLRPDPTDRKSDLDLKHLPEGVYYLNLRAEAGIQTLKIVISK